MFILTSLWEVAAVALLRTRTSWCRRCAPHNGKALTSCFENSRQKKNENNTTSMSVTFIIFLFGLDGCDTAPRNRIFSPRNFSNRAQRSTQPRILLFSLETLICNRSPLPLPLAAAYVITSSCVGRSLSHTHFGATFLAPKHSFAPR